MLTNKRESNFADSCLDLYILGFKEWFGNIAVYWFVELLFIQPFSQHFLGLAGLSSWYSDNNLDWVNDF